MKKFLLTSVAVLGITGAASAADLAVKAPIVAPVPVFSWTGFYVGIGGGTGWGTEEYQINQDAVASQLIPSQAFGRPLGSNVSSHAINGGFFGGQIGYNYQVGWAVLGIQGDAHWADINGKGSCGDLSGVNGAWEFPNFDGFGIAANCASKVTSFGSVTGRLGAAVLDRTMLYVKGGWAWENSENTLTYTGVNALFQDLTGSSSITQSTVKQSRSGWTWGVGAEYAFVFLPGWSLFAEYNHFDFGTKNQNHAGILTAVPGGGVVDSAPSGTRIVTPIDVTESFHTIKAGLNYRFNWGAPVIARY